jgi:ABC-type antimicrobial peptide transport system permease subunit
MTDALSMKEILFNATARMRFALLIVLLSCSLALALAVVGVTALVSYVVAERSNEFGVRMALGAQPGNILRLIVIYGAKLAALGLTVGLVVTFFAVPSLSHFIYGIPTRDIPSFVGAIALLIACVLVACYLPARRVIAIDPASTLRRE